MIRLAVLVLIVLLVASLGLFHVPGFIPPQGRLIRLDHGFVIVPPRFAEGNPWVWYAPVVDKVPGAKQKWIFSQLLDRGIAVAGVDVGESYGSPQGVDEFVKFQKTVRERLHLSSRPCMLAQSRGGLMVYNYALQHPDSVCCVGAIYPVVNLESWPPEIADAAKAYHQTPAEFRNHRSELSPLSHAEELRTLPTFHLHGDSDSVVPIAENSIPFTAKTNGRLTIVPGRGHEEVDEFFHSADLVNFLSRESFSCSRDERLTIRGPASSR